MAAAGVGDGGEDESQCGPVEAAQDVAEIDWGCLVGADGGGDPQKPLFTTGQSVEVFGDGGVVDPVRSVGALDPWPFFGGEAPLWARMSSSVAASVVCRPCAHRRS